MSHIRIPPGLTELLQGYTVEVLRQQPPDLVDFAVGYFTRLREARCPAEPPAAPPDAGAAGLQPEPGPAADASAGSESDDEDLDGRRGRGPSRGLRGRIRAWGSGGGPGARRGRGARPGGRGGAAGSGSLRGGRAARRGARPGRRLLSAGAGRGSVPGRRLRKGLAGSSDWGTWKPTETSEGEAHPPQGSGTRLVAAVVLCLCRRALGPFPASPSPLSETWAPECVCIWLTGVAPGWGGQQ